jgi:uncharacterized protein (DUF885 family)
MPASTGDPLARLVDGYWDEYRRLNPLELPAGAAKRYDSAGGYDISEQFLADSLDLERRYLEALLAVPRPQLRVESRLTYDLFKRERELAIESFTYPSELLPVNPFRSLPLEFARCGEGDGPYAILNAKDYVNWQARADAYVRWTALAIANLREGMRRGYTLPRVIVEELLPILAELGADSPSNVFYRPLRGLPATLADAERRRISVGVTARVKDDILPAYRLMHDFLRDEYLSRARSSVGLSALPLGTTWYAFLIRRETASRRSPSELHALGIAETERLHQRLQALLAEAGFGGTAQAFFEARQRAPEPRAAEDTSAASGASAPSGPPAPSGASPASGTPAASGTSAPSGTPEDLQGFYDKLKADAVAALPKAFARLPQADFAIRRRVVAYQAAAPALFYERAPNPNYPAILEVDAGTADRPASPEPALFLREALPGYHFALASQEELSALPRFRRLGGDPGFVEGWGMYAESLGEELGLYPSAESKFEALRDELECAAGLVVDTGLHALGWSRGQALDYWRAQVPGEEAAARRAVDRAIALPGEALACALGGRLMQGMRARAEQTLGARFDEREFHSQLLDNGAMPLDLLESTVDGWLSGPH